DDADALILRPHHADDEAVPSANGQLVSVFTELWLLTGREAYQERAGEILATFAGAARENVFTACSLLAGFGRLLAALSVVVVGRAGPERDALVAAVHAAAVPDAALLVLETGAGLPPDHPASGKGPAGGMPSAY